MLTRKKLTTILSSGAVILTLGAAITGLLVYSPPAEAGPNSVLADLKVKSIGTLNGAGHWCPTYPNSSSMTYRVVYENVRDDDARLARVSFTTGSNQALSVSFVGASYSPAPTPVCTIWTAPNGYSKVAYCDIDVWNTMGATLTFDFTVTSSADDLNVAAQVSSLLPEGDGQGVSLMANNYLEHAFDSACDR